jgi:hypothetical protein
MRTGRPAVIHEDKQLCRRGQENEHSCRELQEDKKFRGGQEDKKFCRE